MRIAVLIGLLFGPPCLLSGAEMEKRVAIVTGENTWHGHRWRQTSAALREIVERTPGFTAVVAPDPNFLASEDLLGFDAVVLDFRNERPLARDEDARANLARFLEQGRGLVVVHWASGAFPYWPGFAEIAGRCQRQKHDPRGPFTVRIVDHDHPITRGLTDFQTDDELFYELQGDLPIRVLASARSVVAGIDQPMAFVHSVGPGRVFHTPLGHDVAALQASGTAELIRRGTAWAARGLPCMNR